MNQMKRKMPRGVRAIEIVAIIDIVVVCCSILFVILWGSGKGSLDARTSGRIIGMEIGNLIFPVITLKLVLGEMHKNAMIVTALLSFTGGALQSLCGIIALIFYFTDPNRKQYFEPYVQSVVIPPTEETRRTKRGES